MSYSQRFFVFGDPKGQPRGRAFKNKAGQVRIYDPGTAEGWKSAIAIAAKSALPAEPLTCPVRLELIFYLKRPARLCKKSSDPAPTWATSKPDIDNLEKAVLDALTTIRMWADDALVVDVSTLKVYHAIGGRPGLNCLIEEVER
jgi:Holliday junction resolvase RusA-like endonuclease